MLFEETPQPLVDDALDDAFDLRGNQLVLGLIREFRIRVLDRNHRGQALADVVAAQTVLQVLEQPRSLRVGVDGPGESRAEPGQVGTAVFVLDVVGEAENDVLVRVVPL